MRLGIREGIMMSKERLEEINNFSSLPLKKRISLTKESIKKELKANDYHMPKNININTQYLLEIIEQAERVEELETTVDFYQSALRDADRRVQELEKRIKELEYASKYNRKLNEFLLKRKLPPNTLGRHVVEVVMDYVEELEQQNKRYREALSIISANLPLDERKHYVYIARKALEGEE